MTISALNVLITLRAQPDGATTHDLVVALTAIDGVRVSHRKVRLLLDALVSVGLVNRYGPHNAPRPLYVGRPRKDDELAQLRCATARYRWARDGYEGARPELDPVAV